MLEMHYRAAFLLGLALGTPACLAQPATTTPWMRGEDLAKLFDMTDQETVVWRGGDFTKKQLVEHIDRTNRQIAEAYVSAVRDATEGKSWCWEKYRPAPLALMGTVSDGLRHLPPDQLKRNAADLIVAMWTKKFPCASSKGTSP